MVKAMRIKFTPYRSQWYGNEIPLLSSTTQRVLQFPNQKFRYNGYCDPLSRFKNNDELEQVVSLPHKRLQLFSSMLLFIIKHSLLLCSRTAGILILQQLLLKIYRTKCSQLPVHFATSSINEHFWAGSCKSQ